MSRFEIIHETRFEYSAPISETVMELRLRPQDGGGQRCLDFHLEVEPRAGIRGYRDGYGNQVHYFNLLRDHPRLRVTSRSLVETGLPARREVDGAALVLDYLRPRPPAGDVPGVRWLAARHRPATSEPAAMEAALDSLALAISRDFVYDTTVTTVYSSVEQVLELRAGVCQDFAQLQIACLRSLGLPARYVSGYLETDPPPDQPRLVGADASHAWVSFFCTGIGWIDVDPTNSVLPTTRHVTVAWGRDYSDVSPIRGVILGGGGHSLKVAVDVVPL